MATYLENLKDPRWQRKRLETLEAAKWACENCGNTTETLNVHHKRYFKGRMPWEYEKEHLLVLCEGCHVEEHSDATLLDQVIASAPVGSAGQIAGMAAGYLDANVDLENPAFVEQVRQLFPMSFELGVVVSIVESMGAGEWRQLVRNFASKNPVTPVVSALIEMWGELETQREAV